MTAGSSWQAGVGARAEQTAEGRPLPLQSLRQSGLVMEVEEPTDLYPKSALVPTKELWLENTYSFLPSFFPLASNCPKMDG